MDPNGMKDIGGAESLRRVFLVGCPRSGTTLLQTMLAQHRVIFTVPETHYFRKIRGRLADRKVGPVVSPRAAARALDALVTATGASSAPAVPRWWPSSGRYIQGFVTAMDAGARAAGATAWLEKSPVHLHHMDEIAGSVAGAAFVHLIRDGRDVVASLVYLCEREPDLWVPQLLPEATNPPVRMELIDAAIRRWNGDVDRSAAWQGRPGHHHVTYEDLVDRPAETLRSITDFLGLPYDDAMERHWESADHVVGHRRHKQHMEKTFQPLEDRRLRRFLTFFSDAEQDHITATLRGGGHTHLALSS